MSRLLAAFLTATLVTGIAVAQPDYTDRRVWVADAAASSAATGSGENVEAARRACHHEVTLGLMEEENYDDPLFRMTAAEKYQRAMLWAREAFAGCMTARGFTEVAGS